MTKMATRFAEFSDPAAAQAYLDKQLTRLGEYYHPEFPIWKRYESISDPMSARR